MLRSSNLRRTASQTLKGGRHLFENFAPLSHSKSRFVRTSFSLNSPDSPTLISLQPHTQHLNTMATECSEPTSAPCQASPLLLLPPELRNMIYRLALVDKHKIDIEAAHLKKLLALTQTCSGIRNESVGIFYAENIFWVPYSPRNAEVHAKWLESVKSHKDLIKNVRFEPPPPPPRHFCDCFQCCSTTLKYFGLARRGYPAQNFPHKHCVPPGHFCSLTPHGYGPRDPEV